MERLINQFFPYTAIEWLHIDRTTQECYSAHEIWR